jgi:channel protein (hemolysin III family)
MRGRLHVVAFFVSLPAGVALILAAQTPLARFAAAIYAISLAGLFGSSASYHIFNWSPKALPRMKRLDHSMIFVLIAGTYTPFALLVVKAPLGIVLLAIAWIGCAQGDPLLEVSDRVVTGKRSEEFGKYLIKLRSQAIIEWKNDDVKKAYLEGVKTASN